MFKWLRRSNPTAQSDPKLEEFRAMVGAKQLEIERLKKRLNRLGKYAASIDTEYPMLPTPDPYRLELSTFRDLWRSMSVCSDEEEDGRERPYLDLSEEYYDGCFDYCYSVRVTLSGQNWDKYDAIFPEYYTDFIALYCENIHQLG